MDSFTLEDRRYMDQALLEARAAMDQGEVPIGAVVVLGEQIIGRGRNQVELLRDSTAHAEVLALTSAFQFLGTKYLEEARIYITLEPCLMCAGAIYWSKIRRIIYGAADEKNGYLRLAGDKSPFLPGTRVGRGLAGEESLALLREFFQSKRG